MAIPQELLALPQWVVWKRETREDKTTKVPYRAKNPDKRASSTDSGTWADYPTALGAVEYGGLADGIGFVFSKDDPYVGVDLDAGVDATTRAAILGALNSYSETSVSGNGVHVIVQASLNNHSRNRKGPIEIYETGRYFVMTGAHIEGTPETIQPRQAELEAVLAEYLPGEEPEPARTVVPIAVDDHDLLERAFRFKNGPEIEALYRGDTGAYGGDDSSADLALCTHLAFLTGRDPVRVDRMFRSSGLMRDKWDERRGTTSYGAMTVEKACAGVSDTYEPRPERSSSPIEINRTIIVIEPPTIVTLHHFINETEEAPKALIGDPDETLLPAGGLLIVGGEGGSSKTTLTLDAVAHIASGLAWMGYETERPVRTLIIENEGPRAQFRNKLRAKYESWDGPDFHYSTYVWEHPWASFNFSLPEHREQLRTYSRENRIDLVVADPLDSLGIEGAGTPENTRTFIAWLRDCGLHDPLNPLAFWILHHYNKIAGGSIIQRLSGAWGNHPDTVLGLELGDGQTTKLTWAKLRHATPPKEKTVALAWNLETRGFTPIDKPPPLDVDEHRMKVFDYVNDHPGEPQSAVEDGVGGGRKAVRNALEWLASENGGKLLAKGPGRAKNGKYYYPSNHAGLGSPNNAGEHFGEQLFGLPGTDVLASSPTPPKGGERGERKPNGETYPEDPDRDIPF